MKRLSAEQAVQFPSLGSVFLTIIIASVTVLIELGVFILWGLI